MDIQVLALKSLRKIYRLLFKPKFPNPPCERDRSKANDAIYELLSSEKPCMISRFGTGEIGIVTNYLCINSKKPIIEKMHRYIVDNTGLPWWDKLYFVSMRRNAGIFPESIDILNKFSERYIRDTPEIDLLGSFNYTEKFQSLRTDVKYVHLECLYPFWAERPWTTALKGKKVLLVHPFTETIKSQYSRRKFIFDDERLLPNFELKTLKAVQSNAGSEVPFSDWFEALKWMEDEIAKIDFDIAIIGCGAYGLPLAATIKRMGKKAVHMGGGTQLLFGIKGKRWDDNKYTGPDASGIYTNYSSLYNEYWVRPLNTETPKSSNLVEGGCYW